MKPIDVSTKQEQQAKVHIEVPVDALPTVEEAFGAVPVTAVAADGSIAEAEIVVSVDDAAALTKIVHEQDGIVREAGGQSGNVVGIALNNSEGILIAVRAASGTDLQTGAASFREIANRLFPVLAFAALRAAFGQPEMVGSNGDRVARQGGLRRSRGLASPVD